MTFSKMCLEFARLLSISKNIPLQLFDLDSQSNKLAVDHGHTVEASSCLEKIIQITTIKLRHG